jgi:hypothetical protein
MNRPIEAEILIEGELKMEETASVEISERTVGQQVIDHLRAYSMGARIIVGAAHEEILAAFRQQHLAQYAAEFSSVKPEQQMTHRLGGTITFIKPLSGRRLYGPQWSLAIFDASVGPELTDQHVKEFRQDILLGLRLQPAQLLEVEIILPAQETEIK